MVEGTTQSLYITRDESSVRRFERWNQEFGHNVFTDEEIEKLAEYARFLIASRRKEDPVFPPSLPLLDNKHAVIFK